jgi:peroxiredoxin
MLDVGAPAPELDHPLVTIDGEETTLAQLAGGKALLLILLKTSCKSCKVGLPFASTLARQLGDAPIKIVAVTQDSPNVTRSFRRRYEVDLPFVVDPAGFPLSTAYDIEATPTWFLIGADGVIKNTGFGVFHQPLNNLLATIAEEVPGAPKLVFSDIDPELPPFIPACPSKHLQEPLAKW